MTLETPAIQKLKAKFSYAVEHNITPTIEIGEMKAVLSELKQVELQLLLQLVPPAKVVEIKPTDPVKKVR